MRTLGVACFPALKQVVRATLKHRGLSAHRPPAGQVFSRGIAWVLADIVLISTPVALGAFS